METTVTEIAAGVYRLSTCVAEIAPPAGFTFNQFLVRADEPLLFHCGQRGLFPSVSAAVARVLSNRGRCRNMGAFRFLEWGAHRCARPRPTVAATQGAARAVHRKGQEVRRIASRARRFGARLGPARVAAAAQRPGKPVRQPRCPGPCALPRKAVDRKLCDPGFRAGVPLSFAAMLPFVRPPRGRRAPGLACIHTGAATGPCLLGRPRLARAAWL